MNDVVGVRFDPAWKEWLEDKAKREFSSVPAIVRRCVAVAGPMIDGGFPIVAPRVKKGRK